MANEEETVGETPASTLTSTIVSKTTLWCCEICGIESPHRTTISQHIVDTQDKTHRTQREPIVTGVGDGHTYCGICGYSSSNSGVRDHIRDKRDRRHQGVMPKTIEPEGSQNSMDVQELMSTRSGWHCGVCGTFSTAFKDIVDQQCVRIERRDTSSFATGGWTEADVDHPERVNHPDRIAHTLVTNEGEPVRISLEDNEAAIPTGPCPEGSPPTETVPCVSFDAVVEFGEIEDAGETLRVRLHLPESEWRRIGLGKHLEADDAEDDGAQRYVDVSASRFDNHEKYDETVYTAPVPDDSPVVTIYEESPHSPTSSPPAPFDVPNLSADAVTTESVRNYHTVWNRVDVGKIASVTSLDTLDEWPEKREQPSRDVDSVPPTKHPSIAYDELSPLDPNAAILEALFTVNRHAKRLSNDADDAYQQDRGADAKKYSVRKRALYAVKTIALHRFAKAAPNDVEIHKHEIRDGTFWCFDFGEYAFHQPLAAVSDDLLADVVGEDATEQSAEVIDFTPSSDINEPDMSLQAALEHLDTSCGLDANDHLTRTYVTDYRWGGKEDIRWDF